MNAFLHSPFAETLGWTLVHSLWQLALLGSAAAAFLAALRKASANIRYLAACAALLLMLAVPIATYIHISPHTSPAAFVPPAPAPAIPSEPLAPAPAITAHRQTPIAPATPPWPARLKSAIRPCLPIAVETYFAGMAVFLLRLAIGYHRLRRFVRAATPIPGTPLLRLQSLARTMHIHRPLRLLQSAAIEVPTLLGAIKPVILLPAAALTGLSTDQLSALLAHELAHIRRHDYLFNLAQSLIETLLFYHPAAWWLSARIRQEREHCCDDAAIAAISTPLAYAQALAAMESLRTPGTLALAATGAHLLPRIRRILSPTPARQPRLLTTSTAAILITLLTALIYLGCNPAAPPPAPPARPTTAAAASQTVMLEIQVFSVPTKVFEDAAARVNLSLAPLPNADGPNAAARQATFDLSKPFDASYPDLPQLLALIQSDRGTRTIASPKFELLSGQAGRIESDDRPVNYVKDFTQTPGDDGTPHTHINIVTLHTGLWIEATAIVDGAKIVTTIHPKWTTLDGMATFTLGGRAGDPPDPRFVQYPRTTVQELQTTIAVPDGGTLLIAGPPHPTEKEVVTTLPGVSQLPGVGKLFTNHTYVKEDYTLLYIIKPSTAAARSLAAGQRDDLSDTPEDRAVRLRLEEICPAFSADHQPLGQTLDLLSARSGAAITVNWDALHEAGIEKNSSVTVSLKEVPFRKVLTTILAQVGGGTANLTYALSDGIIIISTKEDMASSAYQILKVFDIRDLLATAAVAEIPNSATAPAADPAQLRQEQLTALIDTITNTVAPDTWTKKGGKIGTIRELNGQLIINQTAENQRAVSALLQQLRESLPPKINLESCVYLVPNTFLDDFRIGWAVPIPTAEAPDSPPAKNASIIDDWTLNLLITAAMADKHTLTWTLPRATVFSGHEAPFAFSAASSTMPAAPASTAPAAGNPAPASLDLSNVPKLAWNLTPTFSPDRRSIILKFGHTPISIPTAGTLLIDGGPLKLDPAQSTPSHHMLILLRPSVTP